jgi:hypothetical protein
VLLEQLYMLRLWLSYLTSIKNCRQLGWPVIYKECDNMHASHTWAHGLSDSPVRSSCSCLKSEQAATSCTGIEDGLFQMMH